MLRICLFYNLDFHQTLVEFPKDNPNTFLTNDAKRSEKNAKPISIVLQKEEKKQSALEPNAAKINSSTSSCQYLPKNSLMIDKSEESYDKQPQDSSQENETSFMEVR